MDLYILAVHTPYRLQDVAHKSVRKFFEIFTKRRPDFFKRERDILYLKFIFFHERKSKAFPPAVTFKILKG